MPYRLIAEFTIKRTAILDVNAETEEEAEELYPSCIITDYADIFTDPNDEIVDGRVIKSHKPLITNKQTAL